MGGKDRRHGLHGQPGTSPGLRWGFVTVACVVIVVAMVAGWWLAAARPSTTEPRTQGNGPGATTAIQKPSAVPQPVAQHHGNSPDCPDTDCIALLVNGDVLVHEDLWNQFAKNPRATDGTAFDFTPLFSNMRQYIQASDVAACQFETPVSQRGGPYTAYPVFNIPPEVIDAIAKVGYNACTHATNHSWDQGAAGISRMWQTMNGDALAQTGSYMSEADSAQPLVVESATGGGDIALLAGTVSLNGMVPDQDWRVDRLRESSDSHHRADIDRAVAKANLARQQGADVVAISIHSVQEYLDKADSWQVSEAHELADTGAFDLIYGTGCHCAQPIENYHGTWIIYGLGNVVTETADQAGHDVNNQGVTARIQFAGKQGGADSWRVSRIDWIPTANVQQGRYRWCSIASDLPDGSCWSATKDAQVRARISKVIYSMGADPSIVREWRITDERAQ